MSFDSPILSNFLAVSYLMDATDSSTKVFIPMTNLTSITVGHENSTSGIFLSTACIIIAAGQHSSQWRQWSLWTLHRCPPQLKSLALLAPRSPVRNLKCPSQEYVWKMQCSHWNSRSQTWSMSADLEDLANISQYHQIQKNISLKYNVDFSFETYRILS